MFLIRDSWRIFKLNFSIFLTLTANIFQINVLKIVKVTNKHAVYYSKKNCNCSPLFYRLRIADAKTFLLRFCRTAEIDVAVFHKQVEKLSRE